MEPARISRRQDIMYWSLVNKLPLVQTRFKDNGKKKKKRFTKRTKTEKTKNKVGETIEFN